MSINILHPLLGLGLGLTFGGSDDCQTPTPISGQGLFAFDLTTATTGTSGQHEIACLSSGSMAIHRDVWFSWTPDVDGCAQVDTCSVGTNVDTRIAAYPGSGCPIDGTALACNDDSCSYQSMIQFEVVAGTTYTIQVGAFPGVPGGPGNLAIAVNPCPAPVLNPANGHYYMVMDGYLPWQTAKAEAAATSIFGVPGHLATLSDATENIFVYYQLNGGPIGLSWIGAYQDMNAPDYAEPAGG